MRERRGQSLVDRDCVQKAIRHWPKTIYSSLAKHSKDPALLVQSPTVSQMDRAKDAGSSPALVSNPMNHRLFV